MIRKFLTCLWTLVGGLVGVGFVYLVKACVHIMAPEGSVFGVSNTELITTAIISSLIFALIFYRLTSYIGLKSKKVADNIENELQGIPTNNLAAGIVGLIVGLLVASLLQGAFSAIKIFWVQLALDVLVYVFCGFVGVIITTRKLSELFAVALAKTKSSQTGNKRHRGGDNSAKILDTSVIIDGRIMDIMKTGFLEGNIIIPEFVLIELQHIADSHDALKRQRGRRGLDILDKIQTEYGIEIYNTSQERALEEIPEVDIKLLKLAQIIGGKVVTNDFNLNKVASIKGVEVLNINELANTLKPVVLPGEEMNVFLVKEGKEQNQAVAFLDDGTMIVVEDGRRFIGNNVTTIVTSVLQTAAGRMIFAKAKK